MTSYTKYIISNKANILDALKALNNLSYVLTLFVVDDFKVLQGTLTDGDIRRHLIEGLSLDQSVCDIMNTKYSFINKDNFNIIELKKIRERDIKLLPLLDSEKRIIDIYNLNKLKSILPVDAVLMAGGKGERLRPMTETTPKPLLKVGSKAIIDYNIESLTEFGISNINVTVNYLADQIEEHFKTPINNVKIKTVREPKFLGTMGSITFVDTFVNDTVLVMNSDLFTNINYEDFYLHFIKNDADMSVAAVPYSVSVPYGIFELEGRKITGIAEKPSYNYYANSGIYLLKKHVLDLIPKGVFFNATDLIDLLIEKNMNVIRFPLVGYWIDIGKPVDYKKAQEFVKHL